VESGSLQQEKTKYSTAGEVLLVPVSFRYNSSRVREEEEEERSHEQIFVNIKVRVK
jgi:hypothetical protein